MRIEEIEFSEQEEDIATWEGIIRELEEKVAERRLAFNGVKERMSQSLQLLRGQDQLVAEHEEVIKGVTSRLQEVRRKIRVSAILPLLMCVCTCIYCVCFCVCITYRYLFMCVCSYIYSDIGHSNKGHNRSDTELFETSVTSTFAASTTSLLLAGRKVSSIQRFHCVCV